MSDFGDLLDRTKKVFLSFEAVVIINKCYKFFLAEGYISEFPGSAAPTRNRKKEMVLAELKRMIKEIEH